MDSSSTAGSTSIPDQSIEGSPTKGGVFYRLNSSRVTVREYSWGTRSPIVLLIALIIKTLRIPIPSSSDDPCVESLEPLEVDQSDLSEDVRAAMEPMLQRLNNLGFSVPIYHAIDDELHSTRTYLATLLHTSGEVCARLHNRIWNVRQPPRNYLYCEFITAFADGSYLWSLASKADLAAPKNCQILRKKGATPDELCKLHFKALQKQKSKKDAVLVKDRVELLSFINLHHATVRDFHLKRGVFAVMRPADIRKVQELRESREIAAKHGLGSPEVLSELKNLQNKQTGWRAGIAVLGVSLLLFVGSGASRWDWEFVWLLMAVLLFHEFGHYVAMRIFGYRNLRMFFIPLFGAAVSGRNYNVAGWKKVIVSLMGPVPGIVLGIAVGLVGILMHKAFLLKLATLAVLINGINLAPVLPLDGGWIVHTILFSRHYLLDAAFRIVAAISLIAGGSFLHDRILTFLGIFMLVGLPLAIRLARVTSSLRKSGFQPVSTDNRTIAPETANTIVAKLKEAFPKGTNNKILAQRTLHVFETLNARPPHWAASTGFLALHFGSIGIAAVFAIIFTVAQTADLAALGRLAGRMPAHRLDPTAIVILERTDTGPVHSTLVATFTKPSESLAAFSDLPLRWPTTGSAQLFGDSVMVILPAADDIRKELLSEFQTRHATVFVSSQKMRATLSLACIAADVSSADQIAQELEEYLRLPAEMRLIPPWTPVNAGTDGIGPLQRISRRTYLRLQSASAKAFSDADMRKLLQDLTRAQQQGDLKEAERLKSKRAELNEQIRQREIRQIGDGNPLEIDKTLVDQYVALSADVHGAEFIKRAAIEFGPRMGQLVPIEQQNGLVAVDVSRGWLDREGLILNLWIDFDDVFIGPAQLSHWLKQKGCSDFKYDLESEMIAEDELDVPN